MNEARYIRCKSDNSLFWSNKFGWVEDGYTIFNSYDENDLNLPLDGEWVKRENGIITPTHKE